MAQTATLTGLGINFNASGLSRNGKVVVGTDAANNVAAYWFNGNVTDLNGPGAGSAAYSCNADGSLIVGQTGANLPFISETGGSGPGTMETLPLLNGTTTGVATLISADGSTIAGVCSGQPCVWTLAGVTALLGTNSFTTLYAISDDGSTIACDFTSGYQNYGANISSAGTNSLNVQYPTLIALQAGGSYEFTNNINAFNPYSGQETEAAYEEIFCLTSDGSTGFGGNYNLYIQPDPAIGAFLPETSGFYAISAARFTGSTNIWGLTYFEVHSCNQDGSVLAGNAISDSYGTSSNSISELSSINLGNATIAFGGNSQDMNAFLTLLGAPTTGWTLKSVLNQGMSADGSVILGSGFDPSSRGENWIATITPVVNQITVSPNNVLGGSPVSGTVSLDYPVGQATTIQITSNNSIVSQTSVIIPQGSMSAPFTLTSSAVSTQATVQLTATLGSSSASKNVFVNPTSLNEFYFGNSTITGGNSTLATVLLQNQAPTGGDVIGISFPSGKQGLSAPATVTVAAGSYNGSFILFSSPISTVTSIPVTVSFNGNSATAYIQLTPYPINELVLSAATAVGGNAVTGHVYLAGAAGAAGDSVTLLSNNSVVTVPPTVLVAAGGTTASFAVGSTPVTAVTSATITATLGASSVSTTIQVIPATVSLVRVSPAPVVGGIGTKVAVYLNGKAPTAGQAVSVSCNSTFATFPTSITVPSGATAANASVTTSAVSAPTTVVVTAKTAAVSTETTFVINPAPLTSIKTTTSTVVGGKSTTLTITLSGKAGPSGLIVQLASSSTKITVPATVVVPAGATTTTVNLTTLAVTSNTGVTLTATTATSTAKYVVTLSP